MSKEKAEIAAWLESTGRQAFRNGKDTAAIIYRNLNAPYEDVWTAFTDRKKLHLWFGDVSGDLKMAATVRCDIGVPDKVTSRILHCEKPSKLLIDWWYEGFSPGYIDEVELRLSADGNNTMLHLEHRSTHGTDPAGVGPGWESWLFRLTKMLDGQKEPQFSEELEAEAVKIWSRV